MASNDRPERRPHFALTAGHLYDLPAFGATYGEDLFGWRDELVRMPPGGEMAQEAFIQRAFGD